MASTNPEKFRQFVFNSSFLQRYEVDAETAARIQADDEAMTEFALAWLKSVLFGDADVLVKPEAIQALKAGKRGE